MSKARRGRLLPLLLVGLFVAPWHPSFELTAGAAAIPGGRPILLGLLFVAASLGLLASVLLWRQRQQRKAAEGARRVLFHQADTGGAASPADDAKDRQLLESLNARAVLEMLEAVPSDDKCHSESCDDSSKTSFGTKASLQHGSTESWTTEGLGVTCRKGLKPESPNQDSWFVLRVRDDYSLYGVFDGHGQKGHDISNFAKDIFPKLLVRDPRFPRDDVCAAFTEAFETVQTLIGLKSRMGHLNATMAGTTATLVLHDVVQQTLTCANVADAEACVVQTGDAEGKWTTTTLVTSHNPNDTQERQRIEASGGRVVFDGYANHRVYARNGRYPGLNMSRCLGDLLGHSDAGLVATPSITEVPLDETAKLMVLCSDGVWEFLQHQELAEILMRDGVPGVDSLDKSAEMVAKEGWDRWIREEGGNVVDNLTVLIAHLEGGQRVLTVVFEELSDKPDELTVRAFGLDGSCAATVTAEKCQEIRWLRKRLSEELRVSGGTLRLLHGSAVARPGRRLGDLYSEQS